VGYDSYFGKLSTSNEKGFLVSGIEIGGELDPVGLLLFRTVTRLHKTAKAGLNAGPYENGD
jgi:hypothetical protein